MSQTGTCSECGGPVEFAEMSVTPFWACRRCGRVKYAGPVVDMSDSGGRKKQPWVFPRGYWTSGGSWASAESQDEEWGS